MTDAIINDFAYIREALAKLEEERAKEPKPELPEHDYSDMFAAVTTLNDDYLG